MDIELNSKFEMQKCKTSRIFLSVFGSILIKHKIPHGILKNEMPIDIRISFFEMPCFILFCLVICGGYHWVSQEKKKIKCNVTFDAR